MNHVCEVCDCKSENIHTLGIVDRTTNRFVGDILYVCDDCFETHEFVVGVIEWDETK